jgi:hypothetical protein
MKRHFTLSTPRGDLHGDLELPEPPPQTPLPPPPRGLVLIARLQLAADERPITEALVADGYAVMNMELLSAAERQYPDTARNVPRLSQRLLTILDLLTKDGDTADLPLALFAAGDVTPAAISVSARRDQQIQALICHGGLIDRAGRQALKLMNTPLLMLFAAAAGFESAAFDRARQYLPAVCESWTLAADEDSSTAVLVWLNHHLPEKAAP